MIDAGEIREAIAATLVSRGLFIVDVKVSRDNDVTVTVESVEANVTFEDCEALNDVILSVFDRDREDYSLTVTSAGLDGEFAVPQQYEKAKGSKVEVWLRGGGKTIGILEDCDKRGISVDGVYYLFENVNKVKYHIDFKF